MAKIQAIRGMNDILPASTPAWRYIEELARLLFEQYGIEEIRTPILESTELFKRSIGEVTDIVEKEMYTFADRNGDSLTLRPEGTASVVRACEEHGLLYNQSQRLWYTGPMFRHERPQKGRYRQFHQIGVECFGFSGPDIDAEIIIMTYRLCRSWDWTGMCGCSLIAWEQPPAASVSRKPLRFISGSSRISWMRTVAGVWIAIRCASWTPSTRNAGLVKRGTCFSDFLDDASRLHFEQLCAFLDTSGVPYELNPALVRGLDYYGLTVFEWVTDTLGAQGTVCAGGRYDGLVEQLGGKACPAGRLCHGD